MGLQEQRVARLRAAERVYAEEIQRLTERQVDPWGWPLNDVEGEVISRQLSAIYQLRAKNSAQLIAAITEALS